eukprot:GHVR01111581.1.p1 GENE.GHVR01111581.1~~GHVR01111581.1.p1  ORF type:complete len:237 (+),score=16.01 GHVR01111581.1:25-735(+)
MLVRITVGLLCSLIIGCMVVSQLTLLGCYNINKHDINDNTIMCPVLPWPLFSILQLEIINNVPRMKQSSLSLFYLFDRSNINNNDYKSDINSYIIQRLILYFACIATIAEDFLYIVGLYIFWKSLLRPLYRLVKYITLFMFILKVIRIIIEKYGNDNELLNISQEWIHTLDTCVNMIYTHIYTYIIVFWKTIVHLAYDAYNNAINNNTIKDTATDISSNLKGVKGNDIRLNNRWEL